DLTRDYYAIDSATNDVAYFGEDVDVYKHGKGASHEGAWLSGGNGARFGLMMPARPERRRGFYQERAPGVRVRLAGRLADREAGARPAGTFEDCVHMVETSPLEKTLRDHKWYARAVGLVKDGAMVLMKYGNR